MNGHFAAVGDGPAAQQYEHGIQVIDEDKTFKFVIHTYPPRCPLRPHWWEGEGGGRKGEVREDTQPKLTAALVLQLESQ